LDKSPDAFRTISEVADDLDLPQHVLRFWETRFAQIRPLKRGGGRRYYRPDDVELLRGIRHLLYGQGYTIKGVQRILKEQGVRTVQAIGRGEGFAPAPGRPVPDDKRPAATPLPASFVATDHDADDSGPDGDDEPADHDSGREAAVPAGLLPPDVVRRLPYARSELSECRRLIAVARGGRDDDG